MNTQALEIWSWPYRFIDVVSQEAALGTLGMRAQGGLQM